MYERDGREFSLSSSMDANNSSANMFDVSYTPLLDSPDSDDFSNNLISFELSDIFEIDNWPVQQADPTLVPHYSNYAANQVVNTRSSTTYHEEPNNSKHFINTTF